MPSHVREALIEGMIDWQQWLNPGPDDPIFPLFEAALDARERKATFEIDGERIAMIAASAAESIKSLGLPAAPAVLAQHLIATGAIGAFVAGKRRRRRVKQDRDDR